MSHSKVEKVRDNSKDRSKSENQNKYKSKDSKNENQKKKSHSSHKKGNELFHLNNAEKKHKNFMYQNLTKAKCYNCDFSESNFDFVSFRGASMKSCKFYGASFKSAEFVGTNLKESHFNNAVLENVVFEGVKLVDVDFKDATFNNVVFLMTDTSEAKHLNLEDEGIRVFKEMPVLEMSDVLKETIEKAMVNKFVKKSRVLDTREGKINYLSVMLLLERFDEAIIIDGLNNLEAIDRDFYTLSFLINLINKKAEK